MARKPRIAMLTTVHRPFDERIFHKQAVSLAAAGFDVVIIAARAIGDATVAGVRLRAIPAARGRLHRATATAWRAMHAALDEQADLYCLHDPELVWVGMALKLRRKKVVYDVHENVHLDIAAKEWMPRWIRGSAAALMRAAETIAARIFDGLVPATEAIARRFPPAKTVRVRNAPWLNELYAAESRRDFADRKRQVIYVGGLEGAGDVRGLRLMLDAMALLPADNPARLLLGGPAPRADFAAWLKEQSGGGRVDYVGWVDRAALKAHLAESVAGLVLYPPMPNNREAEPVKFFEIAAAGLPIICTDLPFMAALVRRWRCGMVVDWRDPASIAAAIDTLSTDDGLAERLGANGRAAIEQEWNWEQEAPKLIAYYRRLASPGEQTFAGASVQA
jgi:glycosyltransferase involved in cell wall biosynthesis